MGQPEVTQLHVQAGPRPESMDYTYIYYDYILTTKKKPLCLRATQASLPPPILRSLKRGRGHVAHCSNPPPPSSCSSAPCGRGPRAALRVEEEVAGLDVAVEELRRVKELQRLQKLPAGPRGRGRGWEVWEGGEGDPAPSPPRLTGEGLDGRKCGLPATGTLGD